ncbi:MAG: ABC transporter permease [Lachnospiraceae bacterium]|nr:ABC transporter permease [Lachnospiraceae bacterium]
MFFKLVSLNSRRSRKENGLFFSSLLISVLAFYMILSLPQQDVMLFLNRMESYAIDRLLSMIPILYGVTLFLLFFLIYYAGRYQLERRRHEFGVCLMLGMRRGRLFAMLLLEELGSSLLSLAVGLPAAVLLSELVSLVTVRLTGIGIIGHQTTLSWKAVLWTAAGFLLIRLAAFLILSGRISRQEIDSLLADAPEDAEKQTASPLHAAAILAGVLCLAAAYGLAISGTAWSGVRTMGTTVAFGLLGTFLFFRGLRFPMELVLKSGRRKDRRLHVFHMRQIQETVIRRSNTLAVCSLLILAALCCFGAGVSIFRYYGQSEPYVLAYTFTGMDSEKDAETVRQTLTAYGLDAPFSDLFEMRIGHIRTTEDYEHAFQMEPVMSALRNMPPSTDTEVLLNNLSYATCPYLISLDSYNRLLSAAGMQELTLAQGEAAVYMNRGFTTPAQIELLDRILESEPEAVLDQETIRLTRTIQTVNLVADRSITLSFALILPDDRFEYYTQGTCSIYLNGVLAEETEAQAGLLAVISDLNDKFDRTGLSYESYLQNMGRQLFYMVAASYITLYLAVIFLLIANTVIGVQFLMGQQKSGRRYRTLVRLGAAYETLCRSAGKQIHWYFGIPAVVAVCSSLFGVWSLLTGILPSSVRNSRSEMLLISAAMILVLSVIELIYIMAVKRASDRYLLTLMVPMREE